MNSINNLCAITINFDMPWLLFLLIPAFALMLFPYFRLKKQHRRTASRVISLVIHSVILLLCVLLLCGMTFHYSQVSIKNDVIFLVDLSDSNLSSKDEMNDFIGKAAEGADSDYRIGIVTFANGCVYSANLNSDSEKAYRDYLSETNTPEGNATDISSALLFARDKLSTPSAGRIIILSDGLQTDGNALATVKTLADEGVRVDTVCFSPKGYKKEVQIVSVDIPTRISVGDTVDITVTLQSASAGTANLHLFEGAGDDPVSTQEIVLNGGIDTYSFEYSITSPRLHEFRVTVSSDDDTVSQNNTYYAYIKVETSTRVLVVEGRANESQLLYGLLEGDFDAERVSINDVPSSLNELLKYDEVILMNVANSDLPAGFDDILTEYVEIYGGGLYTVGGDKAYEQSDMNGSKYEELLPVEANTDAKSLGLLLVIDCSGSMDEKAQGSVKTRIDLAIDAALASVDVLDPDDYVGVITFNSTANLLVDMSLVSANITTIKQQIRRITTATGTQFYNALNMARNTLSTFTATDLRHVIFLTDGEPVDADKANFMNEIDRMARMDITLSTIALGASVPIDTAKEMAERGGGRFYEVVRETELARIMVEETTTAAGQHLNEFSFTPSIVNHTSAVAGVTALPELDGFYGSRLKDGATMVLGFEGSPIYAEWQRGEGRVGSFMCDLNGGWSSGFLTDENGVKFILNTVNGLLCKIPKSVSDISAEFINDNFTTEIAVSTDAANGETVLAEIITPSGKTVSLKLEKLADGLHSGTFATDEQGIYTVRITQVGINGLTEVTVYTAVSYSREYDAFADDTQCFAFMEALSGDGNGKVLFSAENLFGKQNEVIEGDFNPQLTFLIIILVLFLADIVVRKFKFRRSAEIARDKGKKDNSEN